MNYLLDTSVLILFLQGNKKQLGHFVDLIEDQNNVIAISVINYWEMTIKRALGKLILPEDWSAIVDEMGFFCFKLETKHIRQLEKLPLLHYDPFDRLLICQSLVEQFKLLTLDEKILQYDLSSLT